MTTTIQYSAYVADEVPREQVDEYGFAGLRRMAMGMNLQVVGEAKDVRRVAEEPAVGIPFTATDGRTIITTVEASDPAAVGMTPDSRKFTWEIEAEPVEALQAVKVEAVVHGEGMLSRAQVPPVVTEGGALVELAHGLGGEVTVLAFNGNGEQVGYTYGVPIDDNTHELMLPPGVARLEASRDPEETETEEGSQ